MWGDEWVWCKLHKSDQNGKCWLQALQFSLAQWFVSITHSILAAARAPPATATLQPRTRTFQWMVQIKSCLHFKQIITSGKEAVDVDVAPGDTLRRQKGWCHSQVEIPMTNIHWSGRLKYNSKYSCMWVVIVAGLLCVSARAGQCEVSSLPSGPTSWRDCFISLAGNARYFGARNHLLAKFGSLDIYWKIILVTAGRIELMS